MSIPVKAGSPNDPVVTEDDEIVDEIPEERKNIVIGSAEEARTAEHRMTHMPWNLHCEVCANAEVQHTAQRKKVVVIEPDAAEPSIPVKFGAQATADHLIKHDDGEEDDGIPTDTVVVVLLDRGTGWIDVYPEGSKSTEHTVEAFQHFAGPKAKLQVFNVTARLR